MGTGRAIAWASIGMMASARAGAAPPPLPEGDEGIAAAYSGDVGIEADPAVIFADDFESYADSSELSTRWDAVYQNDRLRIASEPGNVFAGDQAVEMEVPQQDTELSNATDKLVSPELDVLFLRYYSKFESPYDVVGSSHNGSMISSHYFVNGQATPGIPADGTNKFLVNLENWRGEQAVASPGLLNVYVYHPEQRSQWGDHFFPDGTVTPYDPDPFDFGPDFEPRPDIVPELDRWYCYELMVQANTPGQRDGRIAFWFEGQLAADFHNLRLRDVDGLTIDRFGLSFHIGSNPNADTHKWYDNVVAATSYIGPFYEGDGDGDGDGESGEADGDGESGEADGDGESGEAGGSNGAGADADAGGCGCVAPDRMPTRWLGFAGLVAVLVWRRRSAIPQV